MSELSKTFQGRSAEIQIPDMLGSAWITIVGTPAFMKEWAAEKMKDITKVLEGLRGLSSKHVALYLLKGAGNACRVLYYVRCCPTDMVGYLVDQFDAELKRTFEDIVGFGVDDSQWDQAALGVKMGGMGITRGNDIADAAYLGRGRPRTRIASAWMRSTYGIMVTLGRMIVQMF